jgi:hypothetical protein
MKQFIIATKQEIFWFDTAKECADKINEISRKVGISWIIWAGKIKAEMEYDKDKRQFVFI